MMLTPAALIAIGVAAWIGSVGLVALIRQWTEQRQLLDIPNERSSHTRPTPRGGGAAIVAVTLLGLVIHTWGFSTASNRASVWYYLIGGALIALVSWLDDLHALPNRVRFSVHLVAAFLALVGFGHWQAVALPAGLSIELGWIGMALTIFWIVGLTNAYNFMDGIDGMAGSQALIAGLGWVYLGWLVQQPQPILLGLLIASSTLGFLWHNWPPARIFMGDVGSAFLGYSFAVLPLLPIAADPRLPVAGALLLWPFLLDTTFTIFQRFRRGENIFSAHRSHLYQRLVIAGHSHRSVTLIYSALAGLGLVMAHLYIVAHPLAPALIYAGLPLACFWLVWFVTLKESRFRHGRQLT